MPEISIRTLQEQPTLVMWGKVAVKDVPQFLERAFHAAATHAEDIGAVIVGLPFARYRPLDSEFREFEVEAGFAVSGDLTGSEEVDVSSLPGGPAAVAWHIGPCDDMVATYDAVLAYLNQRHAEPLGAPWEIYHSDPDDEPDQSKWRTEIVQPFMA